MKKLINLLLLLLVAIFCFLFPFTIETINKRQKADLALQIQALSDTLVKYKNKDGINTARIKILQDRSTKNFLSIKSKDSTIQFLQHEVKRYKKQIKKQGSVTVIGTNTNVTGTIPIVSSDTSQASIQPFSFHFSDQWIDLSGQEINDSLSFNLSVRNDYTIAIGYEKREPFVELTNHNPYTDTKYLRTFNVTERKTSRWSLGFQFGYGVTWRNVEPYIGVGLQYTILRL